MSFKIFKNLVTTFLLVCGSVGLAITTVNSQTTGLPGIDSLFDLSLARSGRLVIFGARNGNDPGDVLIDRVFQASRSGQMVEGNRKKTNE